MVEKTRSKESHWWWFEGHKSTKQSPWLQSTIEELDEKTKAMLRLIEEDADSFAQRAEMLYKKKPELIGMVEDFYRAHRSLAERYDLVKAEPVTRLSTPMASPLASSKSKSEKVTSIADQLYDIYSISSISEDYNDSEIDDSDQAEKEPEQAMVSNVMENEELEKLKDEIGKLKEESRLHKAELLKKDEEKREVIRHLCIAIEMLKEENANLRRTVASATKGPRINRSRSPALNKFNEFFSGKWFNFPKPKSSLT
uniref:NAB domain-containing protein n=1 Tax=Kalanchoe fedtschenkoi TaxID=63787 RepID=A0A7N0TAM4_KALFE